MCQWILLVKAVDRWYCTLSTCPTTLEIKHTEPEGIGPQKEQKNSQVSRKSSNLPWFYGCFLKYLVKLGVPKPPKKRLTIHLLPFIFLFDRPTISFLPKNIERLDLGSLVLRHQGYLSISVANRVGPFWQLVDAESYEWKFDSQCFAVLDMFGVEILGSQHQTCTMSFKVTVTNVLKTGKKY